MEAKGGEERSRIGVSNQAREEVRKVHSMDISEKSNSLLIDRYHERVRIVSSERLFRTAPGAYSASMIRSVLKEQFQFRLKALAGELPGIQKSTW